jgi:alpha-glucosidase (family GH31 glycosyl hydrolase)
MFLCGCGAPSGDAGEAVDAARPVDAALPVDAARPGDAGDVTRPIDAGDAAQPAPCDALEAEAEVGGWRVRVVGPRWTLTPPGGDAPTLEGPTGCEADAPAVESATGAPAVTNNFGAFKIELESAASAMRWTATSAPTLSVAPDAVTLTYADGARMRFEAEPARPGHLWLRAVAGDSAATGVGLRLACRPGEAFFGAGTQSVDLDLRGRAYPLWTQEQGIGKPEGGLGFPLRNIPEAAYAPMGLWHALRQTPDGPLGYAALLGEDDFAELDLCKADAEAVRVRTLRPDLSVLLVPGATPRERLSALTTVTGRLPDAPPDWVFAPWNDTVGGPERVRSLAETLRREGIPSSAVWAEDWIGGEETGAGYRLSYAWAWDQTRYPALAEDIAWLHSNGFAFLAYFNPFVPETTAMWREGLDGGFLLERADGTTVSFLDPAFRNASMVDLSHPPARAWLASYLERAAAPVERGGLDIDGWMADFAEWLPVDTRLRSGETGFEAHNRYPLMWQALNREVLDRVRGPGRWVYFARSGWASARGGTSGLAPTLWGGDQNTDWGFDDGLPTVVPIGAHAGFGGVAIFGSDIGGYTAVRTPPTTKALFFRWTSLAALTPLMRTHHGSTECRNWSFDRDADTLAHYRRYARLHSRLYPYLRGLLDEALVHGWPLMRHPALVEPASPGLWAAGERSFFLGDDVWVAPVVQAEVDAWPVRLPPGRWWPLLGGDAVEAPAPGEDLVWPAAATEVPAFVRAGTALPLLTEAPDSLYPGAAEPILGLERARRRLTIALYPDAQGGVAARALSTWTDVDGVVAEVSAVMLPASGRAVVVGPGNAALGDGRVEVRGGPPDVEYTFVVGAEAWGDLRAPTPLGDLFAEVPPPCEAGAQAGP